MGLPDRIKALRTQSTHAACICQHLRHTPRFVKDHDPKLPPRQDGFSVPEHVISMRYWKKKFFKSIVYNVDVIMNKTRSENSNDTGGLMYGNRTPAGRDHLK